jgi:uncharacterized damage-inducible protein DinB
MKAAVLSTLLLLAPAMIAAQTPSSSALGDWGRSRKNVLAYIDAMPDSAMGFRPTPGVRSFAEQFDHIVTTNLQVAARALKGAQQPPALGDSAVYLHDKAALKAYATATYDYVLEALTAATPASLAQPTKVYGPDIQPAFRWMELSLEHSVWTLGQTVPYLRLNGVTPPAYDIPF